MQGREVHTLTSTAVEITSGATFSVTLNSADKTALSSLLNKNGTSSQDSTTYNLAAAEDWAAGADASVTVADLTGNGITVSNYVAPVTSGGGGSGSSSGSDRGSSSSSGSSSNSPNNSANTPPQPDNSSGNNEPSDPTGSPVLGLQPQEVAIILQLQSPLTIGNHTYTQAAVGTKNRDNVTGTKAGEVIAGGGNKDRLTGRGGPDAFLFETPGEFGKQSFDAVADFMSNKGDTVALAQEAFNGISTVRFQAANGKKETRIAAATNRNIIYNQKTGMLYFNENGRKPGWGDGGEFVKLLGAPEIGSGDFAVV